MMIDEAFIGSDLFFSLPLSVQLLYFHLVARADNDNYLHNPLAICRLVDASEEDYKILFDMKIIAKAKDFGIIIIK